LNIELSDAEFEALR